MLLIILLALSDASWCGPPLPCDYMKTTPTILTNYSIPIHVLANRTYFYGIYSHAFQFDNYLGLAPCEQMIHPIELTIPYPNEWTWNITIPDKSIWISFNFQDELSLVRWCVRLTNSSVILTLAIYGVPCEIRIGFNSTCY